MRVRYAKRGRLRFTSHRDFGRALERALVRARLPVAYSSGFNPHPRISYANAAPTGAATEAEYLEIGLTQAAEPDEVRRRLDEALPAGLDVVDVVVAGTGALADRLEASRWTIRLPGVPVSRSTTAVEAFLAAETIEVERLTKRGVRAFDCRDAVERLAVYADTASGEECAILDLVVRHGTPVVRPDDVLAGLREVAGLEPPVPPLLTRVAQGPLDAQSGSVGDPLAPDRDAPHPAATADRSSGSDHATHESEDVADVPVEG